MAWNARKGLVNPPDFEMHRTRHVAVFCLRLVVVTVLGSTATHIWSQENVTAKNKIDSTIQKVTEVEPASVQDLGTQPAAQPATKITEPSSASPTGNNPEETPPPIRPVTPLPSSDASSASGDTMQNTAADGTVSIVIQPETKSSPPPAELTRPSTPIDPQNPSAMSDAKAITPPDKTAATLLLERILEPLEFNKANNHIDPTRTASLYARPLPLIEALQRSGDRSRRLWITQAYWQVSRGYANIRFATEARERLEFIAPGSDPHDQMVLDVASAAAEADLADAHAELIAAQQQLVDLVRLPIGEPAPWPVDRPLAGSYETHFAAIFATRPATGRIRAIDRMLPSKHDAVEARAIAVEAAESAMNRAESDHARGKRPIEAVVAAHRMLRQQQQEFAESLATYNLDIAEYAMAVADTSVPDDRYVSMLIGTPIQWKPQTASNVIPATGLQPIEQTTTLPQP